MLIWKKKEGKKERKKAVKKRKHTGGSERRKEGRNVKVREEVENDLALQVLFTQMFMYLMAKCNHTSQHVGQWGERLKCPTLESNLRRIDLQPNVLSSQYTCQNKKTRTLNIEAALVPFSGRSSQMSSEDRLPELRERRTFLTWHINKGRKNNSLPIPLFYN